MAESLNTKTFTAPKAIIWVNNKPSGFMRNVRVSENIQRGEVRGIGNIAAQELPALSISCSLTCDFFFINLKRPEMRAFLNRDLGAEVLLNTLILGDGATSIQILSKKAGTRENKVVTSLDSPETIAVIDDFYTEGQNFDIAEGQISGSNISGRYLTPVFFTE